MKTILIPTDFSDDAKHAARYGAAMAKDLNVEKIILYNAYSLPLASEMTWALMESDNLKRASEQGVKSERTSLLPFCGPNIIVEAVSEFGFMAEQIDHFAKEHQVDLVIMGISDSNKLEQVLIGSSALTVIQNTDIPVLVVPPDAVWKHIEQIAWACDFKKIEENAPIEAIKEVLKMTGARLHVVHNEPDLKNYNPELVEEDVFIHDMFKEEQPEYALLTGDDLATTIDGYVKSHDIQWLISIPKEHGWWDGLFAKDNVKNLAFHTHIPMLCLKKINLN